MRLHNHPFLFVLFLTILSSRGLAQNQIVSYDLLFEIFPEEKKIKGHNRITFKAAQTQKKLQLALKEPLGVDSIILSGIKIDFKRNKDTLLIPLAKIDKSRPNLNVDIYFSGKPQTAVMPPWSGGFIWEKDSLGRHWVNVACQNEGAQLWWPVDPDLSNEPQSASISIIAPATLEAISNGRLAKKQSLADGKTLSKWEVSYPINTYNISIYLGHYVLITDTLQRNGKTLDLHYYVLDYEKEKAKRWFGEEVKPMLRCYESAFGTYPFENDGFKIVQSTYAGMEHQSAIAYGNGFAPGYKGEDYSGIGIDFDFILVHESGHEWWGNSVSKKSREDFWIHEAFCTYAEKVYVNCHYGNEIAEAYMRNKRSMVKNKYPIAGRLQPLLETTDLYTKGALFISNLEHIIRRNTSWEVFLKSFAQENKHKNIETRDVITQFSQAAGFDLNHIFEQFLYYTNLPILEYHFESFEKNEWILHYRWNADVAKFNMPVTAQINDRNEWFYPGAEWKTQLISIENPKDFSWREDLFYAKFKKVR
ncbi:MAG: M1 family metallopeptidase [Flavobacteriales bacterium]